MKTFVLSLLVIFGSTVSFAQTAHENFMNSKIKTNTSGDFNQWVHGTNDFETIVANDWNKWHFSYLGLECGIETVTSNDYTMWKVNDLDITITNANGDFNSWTILGQNHSVSLTTSNWNTWALTGALNGGISSTVNDDFSEFVIQGGDWTSLSPQYRASLVFISVLSSSVLKNLSE